MKVVRDTLEANRMGSSSSNPTVPISRKEAEILSTVHHQDRHLERAATASSDRLVWVERVVVEFLTVLLRVGEAFLVIHKVM